MEEQPLARSPLLLVHGGLADDMDAERFWTSPGIVRALVDRGWTVIAPDRDTTPESWARAAERMADLLEGPTTVVAGSNGVSVGLRLAVDHPHLVDRLLLLWPATAGDATVDRRVPPSAEHLLSGETIRGVTESELTTLRIPVAVMASSPENPFHQHRTVARLAALVPDATVIAEAFPESPHPDFAGSLDRFVDVLVEHLVGRPAAR